MCIYIYISIRIKVRGDLLIYRRAAHRGFSREHAPVGQRRPGGFHGGHEEAAAAASRSMGSKTLCLSRGPQGRIERRILQFMVS